MKNKMNQDLDDVSSNKTSNQNNEVDDRQLNLPNSFKKWCQDDKFNKAIMATMVLKNFMNDNPA